MSPIKTASGSRPPENSRARINQDGTPLQSWQWPVTAPALPGEEVRKFLLLSKREQRRCLVALRRRSFAPAGTGTTPSAQAGEGLQYSALIHEGLSAAYADFYGYADSPTRADAKVSETARLAMERRLTESRMVLDEELFRHWLGLYPLPSDTTALIGDQRALGEMLRGRLASNMSRHHPLFEFIATEADERALREFLWSECARTEVVDDEVALLSLSKQGVIKAAIGLNFGDEIGIVGGQSMLRAFHTYWLRELLQGLGGPERFLSWRKTKPWFTAITSNVFNALLTRPRFRMAALGYFIVTEALVEPHFRQILAGIRRAGWVRHAHYFQAHCKIDPYHYEELIGAIERQRPELTPLESTSIVLGAEIALRASKVAYDLMYSHLARRPNQ